MPDQTPDYVPPPRGSGAGLVIGMVVAVLLLFVCGVGLLGVGFLSFRAVDVQVQPPPINQPQPMEVAPPAEPSAEEAATPAPATPAP